MPFLLNGLCLYIKNESIDGESLACSSSEYSNSGPHLLDLCCLQNPRSRVLFCTLQDNEARQSFPQSSALIDLDE